jgi:bacterioferritin
MQGSARVIEVLNEILTAELTAVNQYFIAAKTAENWGYAKLYKAYYDDSIAEMKHAEHIIERVLFLEGVPNMQRLSTVRVGETVIEQFRANFEMEVQAVERYRGAVALCTDEGDPGTRTLLEGFLRDEESHVDHAEAELELYEQLGEQLWLAKWV